MSSQKQNKIERNNKLIKTMKRNASDSKWASVLATCGGCGSLIAAVAYSMDEKTDSAIALALIAAILYGCAYSTKQYYNKTQRQMKQLRHKNNKIKSR